MSEDGWTGVSRKPRAYEVVVCRTASGEEYHGLCWSRSRGAFNEPISNRSAEEVIGPIAAWRYPDVEPDSLPTP
ncbi:MAG: hypothetical protein ACXIU8_13160 [Alkalilacustris sp.]